MRRVNQQKSITWEQIAQLANDVLANGTENITMETPAAVSCQLHQLAQPLQAHIISEYNEATLPHQHSPLTCAMSSTIPADTGLMLPQASGSLNFVAQTVEPLVEQHAPQAIEAEPLDQFVLQGFVEHHHCFAGGVQDGANVEDQNSTTYTYKCLNSTTTPPCQNFPPCATLVSGEHLPPDILITPDKAVSQSVTLQARAGGQLDNTQTNLVSHCPEVWCLDDLILPAQYVESSQVIGQ